MKEKLIYNFDTKCNLCNSTETKLLFKNVLDPYGKITDIFSIYFCKNCKVNFSYPKIENKDLSFLYGDKYFSSKNKLSAFEKFYRFDQYRNDLNIFKNLISKTDSILDYGCGDGSRVEFLVTSGHKKTFGIDLYDSFSAELGKAKYYIKANPLKYAPKNKYKVVTLYHVLEHLKFPLESLKHIRNKLLSPGGYLVIQVPNAGSKQFQKYKEKWTGLDVPRHLWHYTPDSLKILLEKNDFEVVEINGKNSILHPTTALSTVYNFDIRNEWQKKNPSKARIYSRFLFFSLISIPGSFLDNHKNQNAMLNVVARKKG